MVTRGIMVIIFEMYRNIQSLWCAPGTNIVLYVSNTSKANKLIGKRDQICGYQKYAQIVKNLPKARETRVWSLGAEDLLEKGMAPVFLHGKSLGQRSLVGDSPWSLEELYTTEQLTFSLFISGVGGAGRGIWRWSKGPTFSYKTNQY